MQSHIIFLHVHSDIGIANIGTELTVSKFTKHGPTIMLSWHNVSLT